MKIKKHIAYLAPEIPALSATFVYQEILQLEKLGHSVKPISIHRPANKARSDVLGLLEKRTFYLYEQSVTKLVLRNIRLLITSPVKYAVTLRGALADAASVGILTHIGKGLLYRFFMAASIVSDLQRENISHIHSNFAHISTDISMYAAALAGITFSFTSHANDLFERGWLLPEKVGRAAFAVTISEYNKNFLIKKGADKEKINVIHCGVDTGKFSSRDDKALGEPPLIGTLGRMVEKKGFDILIQACGILKSNNVDFSLQIAGDGPLMGRLKELIVSHNLADQIKLIGPLSHEDVPGWIKLLDIFVLPCKEDEHGDMDGIPVVLMEAMLSGVSVISSKISGIPELIIDGETGFLCDPDDKESLAVKLSEMLSTNDSLASQRKKAASKVIADFELSNNVQQLSTLFDDFLLAH